MFSIRAYKPKDYERFLLDWWQYGQSVPPAIEMLPIETTWVCYAGDTPMCAASLLLTNSPVAIGENLVGNPMYRGAQRKEAVNFLVKWVENYAKAQGYKHLFFMTKQEKLLNRYKYLGYRVAQSNAYGMTKEL